MIKFTLACRNESCKENGRTYLWVSSRKFCSPPELCSSCGNSVPRENIEFIDEIIKEE